jgi:hypothetical protein
MSAKLVSLKDMKTTIHMSRTMNMTGGMQAPRKISRREDTREAGSSIYSLIKDEQHMNCPLFSRKNSKINIQKLLF